MKHVKRILLSTLLVILALALSCTAMADAIRDWNVTCTMKTADKTTVYSLSNRTKAIAIIPAGTYVQVSATDEGWNTVSYTTASGIMGYGYVESTALVTAMVEYTDSNGNTATVHELLYNNGNILTPEGKPQAEENKKTEDEQKPAQKNEPATTEPEEEPEVTDEPDEEPVPEEPAKPNLPKTAYEVNWVSGDAEPVPVMLVTLGVSSSKVVANDEWIDVPTAELAFETEVTGMQKLAVISAPNSGECTLRSKADAKSSAVRKCSAGKVVVVLEVDEKFCKVNIEGSEGYILTSLLKFVGEGVEATGTGVLSAKGKTTGNANVNIRNSANKNTAKVAVLRVGTPVTIFSYENGWYEIEHEGVHGYVMDDFLTPDE